MTIYTATAAREGAWWLIDVGDLGSTQSRTLSGAPRAARGLISAMLDVDESEVQVRVIAHIDDLTDQEIAEAKAAAEELARTQERVGELSRRLARRLVTEQHLSGADAAVALDVSPQRVSQLIRPAAR